MCVSSHGKNTSLCWTSGCKSKSHMQSMHSALSLLSGSGVGDGPGQALGVCPWGHLYPPLPQLPGCPCLQHPAGKVRLAYHFYVECICRLAGEQKKAVMPCLLCCQTMTWQEQLLNSVSAASGPRCNRHATHCQQPRTAWSCSQNACLRSCCLVKSRVSAHHLAIGPVSMVLRCMTVKTFASVAQIRMLNKLLWRDKGCPARTWPSS